MTEIRISSSILGVMLVVLAQQAQASDFGVSGLISVPSARVMNDGFLAATVSTNQVANIFTIAYQATPRLETAFRYSLFNPYDRIESTDRSRDRSYEVKYQFFDERELRPALALGIRDILGTGIWNGEYLVASKRVGLADISLGLGWGRFSQRDRLKNPLAWIIDGFEERRFQRSGGELRTGSFFRGPTGIFGGLQLKLTPTVTLAFERTSDAYLRELERGSLDDNSGFGYGLSWTPHPALSAAISYQNNDYWSLSLRSMGDFKSNASRKYTDIYSSLDEKGASQAPSFLNLDHWYDRLLFDAERTGLRIYGSSYAPGSTDITLEIANDRYAQSGDAIHQALVLSDIHLPQTFRYVELLLLEDELPAATIRYQRRPVSSARLNSRVVSEVSILPPLRKLRRQHSTDFNYPRLQTGADLALRLQLMDPNEPIKHQFYIRGNAGVAFSPSLNLWSSYTVNLTNDFNTKRPSDSVLPRVRSEINRYLTEGENGIDSFYIEHKRSFGGDLLARSYAGIFEDMFGGFGGELLYAPFMKRWALGANIAWVKQREYQKKLSFQNYAVVTGHASAFYASPWYNLDFGFHLGRYLAGDYGYTIEARRTLDNGFSLGAFFTRTNVSAEDFGEGNFDKGLYFRIPFNLLFPFNTRSSYRTVVRSIERDGGRRLEGFAGELWWNRRAVRPDALLRQRSRMLP
jgi:hypothetical protein